MDEFPQRGTPASVARFSTYFRQTPLASTHSVITSDCSVRFIERSCFFWISYTAPNPSLFARALKLSIAVFAETKLQLSVSRTPFE